MSGPSFTSTPEIRCSPSKVILVFPAIGPLVDWIVVNTGSCTIPEKKTNYTLKKLLSKHDSTECIE